MKKTLLSAVAICLFSATAALAQTTPAQTTPAQVEDGSTKTKETIDGTTIKTKVDPEDGKMKVKGKDKHGNKMKAHTKPRKDSTSVTTPAPTN